MTLDPWQELWISGIKTLDPFEKNCGVGKKQLCRIMKSMLVGWKLWIRNKIFYFIAPFFTLLRMVFQNNSDPYWSNSWLARLSPLAISWCKSSPIKGGRTALDKWINANSAEITSRAKHVCAMLHVCRLLAWSSRFKKINFSVKENYRELELSQTK